MKLINESSRPTEEVRRLVRYGVQGLNHKGIPVTVVDARKSAWDGKIYCSGLARYWHPRSIVIRIAPDSEFPSKVGGDIAGISQRLATGKTGKKLS